MGASVPRGRFLLGVSAFSLCIATDAVLNGFVPRAFSGAQQWAFPPTVPVLTPRGSDLAIFVEASRRMLQGENPLHDNYVSPPFTALFYAPFTLLAPRTAYAVHFGLLVAASLLTLCLIFRTLDLAEVSSREPKDGGWTHVAVLALVSVMSFALQFRSYALEFALERGNYDAIAALSVSAGVYSSVRRPGSRWLAVLCFTVATHLKVYPAIFLLLLVFRSGFRVVLPILGTNCAFLFCFGYARGVEFLAALHRYSLQPYVWRGNHSAVSFSRQFVEPTLSTVCSSSNARLVSLALLIGIPACLWLHAVVRFRRHPESARVFVLLAAIAATLTSIVPSVSHDYKLVAQIFPIAVALYHFTTLFVERGGFLMFGGMVVVLVCSAWLARSTIIPTPLPALLVNKYLAVLSLEAAVYALGYSASLLSRRDAPRMPA